MTDKRWNDDIDYVFSTHRVFLRIYGLWPLQTQTVFTKIRWGICVIVQFTILPWLIMDLLWNGQDANSNMECILLLALTMMGYIKNLCIVISQKKLGTNINAAIDNWLSSEDNEDSKKIMMKYAVKAKMLTSALLYLLYMCLVIYISVIMFINLKQIFFTDAKLVDVNTTNWVFLIPSGPLSSLLTGSQYAIILSIQIVQVLALTTFLCIVDSFFFNVIVHLTAQLELFKNKIKIFTFKPNIEANYQKIFVGLINRHRELMELFQNLEDSFHILILSQLVVTTVLLALSGLRLNIFLNEKNYIEAAKCVITLTYLLMQAMLFTYGGEFLQKESEDIFYALYTTSWFTLPLALAKDLRFAMMRSSIPFHLTGGKFFYVNRETMMSILQTAASYVSVLRIMLLE